jgi:hypothetical protein
MCFYRLSVQSEGLCMYEHTYVGWLRWYKWFKKHRGTQQQGVGDYISMCVHNSLPFFFDFILFTNNPLLSSHGLPSLYH